MPGPAVYVAVAVIGVLAVGIAFHEFVYEPHIAPKVEAWAESYVEQRKQRRRRRYGPVPTQPVDEHRDENRSRRSSSDSDDPRDMSGSIELEELAARERDEWERNASSSGLRHRRTAGAMDESNAFIAHPVMSPTHVIFDSDTSAPSSPGGHSIRTSAPPSLDNSPARPVIVLSESRPSAPLSPPPRVLSPRLPTPMSNFSAPSSRALSPTIPTPSERSPLSSRRPSPDLGASQAFTSAYNTPLGGSLVMNNDHAYNDVQLQPESRIQSPFSDIYSVDARSSPEHPLAAASTSPPRGRSPSIASDFTLDSDEEFDMLSPRSGIFSPPNRVVDDDLFDVVSHHGSDDSWSSGGSHSPRDHF